MKLEVEMTNMTASKKSSSNISETETIGLLDYDMEGGSELEDDEEEQRLEDQVRAEYKEGISHLPLRCRWCKRNEKYVAKYDHYCIVLGTCIGERNHCRFWWYLLAQTIALGWAISVVLTGIEYRMYWSTWFSTNLNKIFCAFVLWCLFFLIFSLLGFHSFLACSNMTSYELRKGSKIDYMADFEERFKPKHRNPITTGWKDIDAIVGGGLGKSELGVVIAPTGAGKSMLLVHLGAAALREGKTVVQYTLELQDTVIANRYDSCITGYPLSDIKNFKQEIYEEIKDFEGNLIIKEYPTKSASTNTMRAHLSRLAKRGINPGMIIVDYADLLKPVTVRKEKRAELESIYEELRALSTEFQCPIWTASQTNRSGLSAEVITMEQISEAFNKCFVADFIFSVSRTIEDKQNNQGKIFIAKNRNVYISSRKL